MSRRNRLTIREVAEAAGVSTQTVSRVLNNRPDVAPETFERVRQVIAETGYAPNMLARGLTQGRTNTIGVVAYGLEYFGPSRIVTGIEREAARLGYAISLNLIHEPETVEIDPMLSGLFARQVDGILWTVPGVGDRGSWSERPDRPLPAPIVLVGGMDGPVSVPSIAVDNRSIGCLATEHLLAGGAKQVACVTGPLRWWEARQRQQGWMDALRSCGLEPDEELTVLGDWTVSSGEQAFYRLIERRPDVDAVFASNDQMALGVLHAAHTLGRRVPEDLAVVGVDNIPEASHFWPSLTTVHQPLDEAGALAVQELDEAIRGASQARHAQDGGAQPLRTLLAPTLIVRESSRPVPATDSTAG